MTEIVMTITATHVFEASASASPETFHVEEVETGS